MQGHVTRLFQEAEAVQHLTMAPMQQVTSSEELSSLLQVLRKCHPLAVYAEAYCSLIKALPSMNFLNEEDGDTIWVMKNIEGDPMKFALVIQRQKLEPVMFYHLFCSESIQNKQAVFNHMVDLVDWSKPTMFQGTPIYLLGKLRAKVKSMDPQPRTKEAGFKGNHFVASNYDVEYFQFANICHFMPKERKTEDSITVSAKNSDITVDYLKPCEVNQVISAWTYRSNSTEDAVHHLVKSKLGLGVYCKGELVSWGVINRIGLVSMVYTKENHRGRGYAKRLFAFAAERAQQLEMPLYSYVMMDNDASLRLHANVGMKRSQEAVFMYYVPHGHDLGWDP